MNPLSKTFLPFLTIAFCAVWFSSCTPENEPPKDIEDIGETVYFAGFEENSNGVNVAKYWKNGEPTNLSDVTTYNYVT